MNFKPYTFEKLNYLLKNILLTPNPTPLTITKSRSSFIKGYFI